MLRSTWAGHFVLVVLSALLEKRMKCLPRDLFATALNGSERCGTHTKLPRVGKFVGREVTQMDRGSEDSLRWDCFGFVNERIPLAAPVISGLQATLNTELSMFMPRNAVSPTPSMHPFVTFIRPCNSCFLMAVDGFDRNLRSDVFQYVDHIANAKQEIRAQFSKRGSKFLDALSEEHVMRAVKYGLLPKLRLKHK